MRAKVVGKVVNKNEEGQISTNLYFVTSIPAWQANNAVSADGVSVMSEWTRMDMSHVRVGMMCEVSYAKTSTGKAVLDSITELQESFGDDEELEL